MKALVFFLVFICCSWLVAAESAYVITLGYSDNTVVFSGISIKNVPVPQPSLVTGYHILEQRNFGGSITYENSFQPVPGTFTVATPYQSDTREIIVRDPQQEAVLSIPVLQFADTCNNGICEPQESFETCSQDCASGGSDDFCDELRDGVCDPDCTGTFDGDCRVEQVFQKTESKGTIKEEKYVLTAPQPAEKAASLNFVIMIIGGLVLIAFIGVGFIVVHTRKTHKINQMREYAAQTLNQGYTPQQIRNTLLSNGYVMGDVNSAMEGLGGFEDK